MNITKLKEMYKVLNQYRDNEIDIDTFKNQMLKIDPQNTLRVHAFSGSKEEISKRFLKELISWSYKQWNNVTIRKEERKWK